MHNRLMDLVVGLFLLVALLMLVFLAFNTANFNSEGEHGKSYHLQASFDDIGSLYNNAAVRLAGVTIGRVSMLSLDTLAYRAKVVLTIRGVPLPVDSEASIDTEGLLGAKYVSITPGFSERMLKEGEEIKRTHSALILEKLIGELLYKFKG